MTDRQFMRAAIRKKKQLENIWTPRMFRALQQQKTPVLDALRRGGVPLAHASVALISPEPIRKVIAALYMAIGPKEAETQYRALMREPEQVKKGYTPPARLKASRGGSMGFDVDFQADIAEYLNRHVLDKVSAPMTGTTMNNVYRALLTGSAQGLGYDEIAKLVTGEDLDRARARLIIRTELNRAINGAHDIGRKAFPYVVEKIWLSAHDNRTRGASKKDKADHYRMHEQTVSESEAFTDPVSKAQFNFPGDSSLGAQAKDVCNYRCNIRFRPMRDANGRLILRKPALPSGPMPKPVPVQPRPLLPSPPKLPVQLPPAPTPTNPIDVARSFAKVLGDKINVQVTDVRVDPVLTNQDLEKYTVKLLELSEKYKPYMGYRGSDVLIAFQGKPVIESSNSASALYAVNFGSQGIRLAVETFARLITDSRQQGRYDSRVIGFWEALNIVYLAYKQEGGAMESIDVFMNVFFAQAVLAPIASGLALQIINLIDEWFSNS